MTGIALLIFPSNVFVAVPKGIYRYAQAKKAIPEDI
jgi:hypothetical protein